MSNSLPAEMYSILENPKRDIWDSFLSANSLGNWRQTMDFGESFKKNYPHARTVRLIATRNGVTEGIAQGIFSEYFGFGTDLDIQEGPLLSTTTVDRTSLLKSIIAALERIGVRNHVMRIRILWPCKWGCVDLFRIMGYKHVGTKIEYSIDLSRGAEDLWKRICGNKRRNIKKALDRGVEFTETSSFEDIEKFHDLLLDLGRRHNFVPKPLSWFQEIWKSLSKKDSSRLFFARWGNNNVSGVFATIHSKTIYALSWGYLGTALDVRPNDLLHWKIMEWGCKRGFFRYHMGNVNPSTEGSQWRWKREWNGDLNYVYVFRKSISKYGLIESVYGQLEKIKVLTRVLHLQVFISRIFRSRAR